MQTTVQVSVQGEDTISAAGAKAVLLGQAGSAQKRLGPQAGATLIGASGSVSGQTAEGTRRGASHSTRPIPGERSAQAVAKPNSRAAQAVQAVQAVQAEQLTAAQEALVLEHYSIVRHVARSIHERLPQHVELEELVGAGTLGLVDAARKFDGAKNVLFRSYAQFRVRGAILDSLRSLDWSPRELRRKARSVEDARRQLEGRLGRLPQESELAAELGFSLLHLQQLIGELKGLEIGTLHAERGEDSGEEELAFLPARETDCPLFRCLEGEARQRLAVAIDCLPERERLVMTLYYFEEMTMKEIGVLLGVVESRVSQIHHVTLGRLRRELADLRGRTGRSAAAVSGIRKAS